MAEKEHMPVFLECYPLTPDRWADFEALFGEHGAYGGCWCMWWRITRSQFAKERGDGNRRAMRALVTSGTVPGILGYRGTAAVGWCSVAPREQFGSLNRSPVLKRIDDRPVWSIVCFFVAKPYRDQGLTQALIRGAIDYARTNGAEIVEAYPTPPKEGRLPPVSSYMGIPAMFHQAGFIECARPSKSKRVMRYFIDAKDESRR
jgi:GNAT superfamily N-acetyltransferase